MKENCTSNVTSSIPWWYPKQSSHYGRTWFDDSMSEEDFYEIGIIANVCLVEIIIGTFNQVDRTARRTQFWRYL